MAKYCTGENSHLEWTDIEKEHAAAHNTIEAFYTKWQIFLYFYKSQIQHSDIKITLKKKGFKL